ncbi:hypothetical protein Pla163_04280 [Planctomycetes bacterium Pla163]|uniref:DUF304 domain-containing protein n=1 Tax=Rohdeia mirabilis TaxID=2528008 RepID=A0A518CVS8_9BACT|nr:hypothetical protein Pla163_04280 [Planctomycetes bacterium Pla163]
MDLVRSARGVRLELEPVGVLVGSRGLLARSATAALPALALTVAVVLTALPQLDSPGLALLVFFVLGNLWLFVALMTVHAIDLGRRRTLIGVVDGALLVERRGALRTQRIAIGRAELERLEVGPHFAVLHQRQLPCLVVARRGADPLHLLAERSVSDLEWIATTLRSALGLVAQADELLDPDNEALASR